MRQQTGSGVSASQASYVLERLLAEGRVSPGEVQRYLGDLPREISELEQRLGALRSATASDVPQGQGGDGRGRAAARPQKRKRKATPGQKLHGSYLGYMRQIPERERGNYAGLRKTKGVEAAIAAMKKALGK